MYEIKCFIYFTVQFRGENIVKWCVNTINPNTLSNSFVSVNILILKHKSYKIC